MAAGADADLKPVDVRRFEGRRVLITGAAGSVGAALSHRLASAPGIRLGLLDHFDHGLLRLVDELLERAPAAQTELMLASVRDQGALARHFEAFAPDMVIHAAALKHVHLGELHPGECILTNLVGVRNVLAAAHSAGVEDFVLISSDKAAAPSCVMGAAKRLAELHLHGFAAEQRTLMQLSAVRFGNVMGSQGSVAPRFAEQIERGGPVTLTHPKMERYFVTMDEAVDLILRVSAFASLQRAPVTYLKNMGEPISILRLAQQMMARGDRDVPIVVSGLRPGEKLTEQLFDEFEQVRESGLAGVYAITPRTSGAALGTLEIDQLETAVQTMQGEALRVHVFTCLDAKLMLPPPTQADRMLDETNKAKAARYVS